VTLIGVLFMAQAGLDLGRMRVLADTAEHAAETPDAGWRSEPDTPAPGTARQGGRL
jgi:hypothetical protein